MVVPEGVPIFKCIRRYELPEMRMLLSMDRDEAIEGGVGEG